MIDDDFVLSPCARCGRQGTVEDVRRGVSCCRSLAALQSYFASRGASVDGCAVLELEGEESDEADWDAADGAVLVLPTRVVRVMPLAEAGF
jgi:hypothetical protein